MVVGGGGAGLMLMPTGEKCKRGKGLRITFYKSRVKRQKSASFTTMLVVEKN